MNWKTIVSTFLVSTVVVGFGAFTAPTRTVGAEPVTITVRADQPSAQINPAMWGAFFEDINFGADGGLYAEMVKNGSFEFPEPLMGWFKIIPSLAKGDVTVLTKEPVHETTPHYAHIVSKTGAPMGICNVGFRGMGVREGEAYDFSAEIRGVEGGPKVTVEIVGSDGTTLAMAPLEGIASDWKKVTAALRPKDTDAHARMTIILQGQGAIDLDSVSLFPQKTWKNRPGGLRADMAQMLADLKPGFLRFPGGCIVEGSDLSKRYQWKNTIGPLEDRQQLVNRWNYEFKHRPTPDYFQSFGLGFFEFFQLCDDIEAEPLPILNCGMACQFNSGELCPPDELGTYIQDAVDLIEFANGSASSPWGAKRAAMGHPEPFHMKLLGVGNEQWGPQYIERLNLFTKALKEKHPEIQLVSAAGPSPDDERFHFLWPKLAELKAEIVDQHCYANPIWFLSNSDRFDRYDRNGPKVFFGEYAAQSVAIVSTKNRNNLECALSEAAYMTGMERNADVVRMASYAPLFANADAWQWTPNLIWVDSLRVVATPNYFVQQLFTQNRGDVVLPVSNTATAKELLPAGRIGVGTSKASAEFKDVRVSRGDRTLLTADFSADAGDWSGGPTWHTADGVYRQADSKAIVTSLAGDKKWTDYTLTLKARKLAGEGNLIFTVGDDDAGAHAQWILGGWGNQSHGIQTHFAEQDQLLDRIPGSIEDNRWYDIKIAIHGARMECYLDGKLVQSADVLHHHVPSLFTSAARDDKTGETILKVVNPGSESTDATIKLSGIDDVQQTGQATVLTGNLTDENSLDKPNTVVPKTQALTGIKPEFKYNFQPHSITVLRLGTAKSSK
jgi:alpha-L-arabinofuranosidase